MACCSMFAYLYVYMRGHAYMCCLLCIVYVACVMWIIRKKLKTHITVLLSLFTNIKNSTPTQNAKQYSFTNTNLWKYTNSPSKWSLKEGIKFCVSRSIVSSTFICTSTISLFRFCGLCRTVKLFHILDIWKIHISSLVIEEDRLYVYGKMWNFGMYLCVCTLTHMHTYTLIHTHMY